MKNLQQIANYISVFALAFLLLSSFTTVEEDAQVLGVQEIDTSSNLLGEVRLWMGWYEPEGWRFCDGQEIDVSRNQDLFDVIGNIYGGTATFDQNIWEWTGTFKLPDLKSKQILNPTNADFNSDNNAGKYIICTIGHKSPYWDTWNQYYEDGIQNEYAW